MYQQPQQNPGVVVVNTGGGGGWKCPHCQQNGAPVMTKECGTKAWVIAIIMVFLFWPAAFCPLCCDGCRDDIRRCNSCNAKLV